jgi:succinoglycan biosynthesis transport protein ExoP
MVVTAGGEVGKRRPLAAVALARALARANRRPLLIDLRDDGADSRSMGEGADLPGFSDLLAGTASFGQVIFRDRQSRVHFIPAGQCPLSGEELADKRVGMLVSALDHTYDHVVFDVGGDVEEAIGPGCEAAVIATEFEDGDPRLALAIKRVRAHSNVPVVILRAGPEAASAATVAAAGGKAA